MASDFYHQQETVDDALAVTFFPSGEGDGFCMLEGVDLNADVWMWRSHWSSVSGLADDGTLRVSRTRMPQANPYPARKGGGQVWIRQDWDPGSPGWSFYIPVGYDSDTLPSYRRGSAKGSRADVRARGTWSAEEGGSWSVEFARALDTGHGEDVVLAAGAETGIAFAVYDRAERGDHAFSEPVLLTISGR